MSVLTEEEIFVAALRKAPDQRAAFLERACGQDAPLRAEVEALLLAHARPDSLLDAPGTCVASGSAAHPSEIVGAKVGPYRLLQQIGDGGFGIVYMAEQQEPVRRKVALKIIKPGMDTKEVIARFESERQVLALMDHPNIAKVFDAGATESGRPYFVMELVKGVQITRFCNESHLAPRDRLELFAQVCTALQHAHQKGIIHRDLKPSNVMVTMRDGQPVPKVIDFGVAKATSQTLTERTLFTAYGQMIGTPAYMSPEQAEMSCLDVDTRSDIYSLGVLLYELLTGTTPFEARRLREAGLAEMQRIIREEDPPKPSTRVSTLQGPALSTLSQHHGIDERQLRQHLRGELDWIVMKSLDKDRERRYESASSLARDIRRYLADEPVQACPPSALYRFRKYAKKHRAVLTTAILLATSLVLGIAGSLWQAVRATQAEARAQVNEETAREKAQEALAERNEAQRQRDTAERQRDEVKTRDQRIQAAQSELRRTLYAAHINLARSAWDAHGPQRVMDLLNQHYPQPGEVDLRGFEWHYLNRLCHQDVLTLVGHAQRVVNVAISPDGKRLASGSYDNTIRLWDAQTGKHIRTHQGGRCVAFSPDSKILASAPWNESRKECAVVVWDVDSGKEFFSVKGGPGEEFDCLAFSPDGDHVAAGSSTYDSAKQDYISGEVKFWNLQTREQSPSLEGRATPVHGLAFSPDGKRLATGDSEGAITLWNLQTAEKIWAVTHPGWLGGLAYSPDGRRVASSASDVKLWDAQTGQELLTIKDAHGGVAFSPDGQRLATAARDKMVKVWDAQTGTELVSLRGHDAGAFGVAFSADGKRLASGSDDRTVKVWDAEPVENPQTLKVGPPVRTVAFTKDGKRLLAATGAWSNPRQAYITGEVKVWDAASLEEVQSFTKHADGVSNVAFTLDAQRVACAPEDNTVRIWDLQTGGEVSTCRGHAQRVLRVAFSADGKRLASASQDGVVKLWDTETAEELWTVQGGPGDLAFSPDGKCLANCFVTVSRSRTLMPAQVKVWDVETGTEKFTLDGAGQIVVFSPDGQRLATGTRLSGVTGPPGIGHAVKVWDAQTGRELFACKGHVDGVTSLAFSAGGKRLASASYDKTIKVWDAWTGQELLTLEEYSGYIGGDHTVAFSSDGHWLVGASGGGTVKIWNAMPLPENRNR